jgi:hypothetical protein
LASNSCPKAAVSCWFQRPKKGATAAVISVRVHAAGDEPMAVPCVGLFALVALAGWLCIRQR